jgi:hypothetical protein
MPLLSVGTGGCGGTSRATSARQSRARKRSARLAKHVAETLAPGDDRALTGGSVWAASGFARSTAPAHPSASACGRHSANRESSISPTGIRHRAAASVSRASIPSRAAKKRFSASTSALKTPRRARLRARDERTTGSARPGGTSRTRDCASITGTSTVPSAGCSRTSHHRKLGSGIAPEAISASTVST